MGGNNTVEIRIKAFADQAKKEMRGFSAQASAAFDRVKRSVFNLQNVMVGAGAGYLAKGFLDAARTTENLGVRLQTLTGSLAEGNRMFDLMRGYAGKVPFEFENIMNSSTALAGIFKGNVDQVAGWMPLIGDLAASQGMAIETATEQVSRMLSVGAASADLFQQRGVNAFLGFKAGVSYSVEKTRQKLLDAWRDPESRFRGATDRMAKTWDGLMSMIGDKWFTARNKILDKAAFDGLKATLSSVVDNFDLVVEAGLRAARISAAGGALYIAWATLPVLVSGVATAVASLRLNLAMMHAWVAAGVPVWSAYNTALFGTQMRLKEIISLKAGVGLLFAAFAGWEIGQFLNKFEAVRIAGALMVGGLMRGWIEFKFGVLEIWKVIQSAWFGVVDGIKAGFRGLLIEVSEGLRMLKAVDTADALWNFAQGMEPAQRKGLEQSLTEVLQDREKALAEHQANVDAMIADATHLPEVNMARPTATGDALGGGQDEDALAKAAQTEAGYWLDSEAAFAQHQQALADLERERLEAAWALQADLSGRINQATMTEVEYKRWALDQEIANMEARANGELTVLAMIADYRTIQEDAITKAAKDAADQRRAAAKNAFMATLQDMRQFGAAGAAVYKAGAIAQTIISTYTSAQKAYEALAWIPLVGPALGAAAAGAAVAAGMARVNAIRSQNVTMAASGGVFDRPTLTIFGEEGPEAVVPLSPGRSADRARVLAQAGLLPSGGGGGVRDVNVSVTFSGPVHLSADREQIQAEIGWAITDAVRGALA